MLFRSDRKSTRLNSSHLVISYAVFCLKKKTTRTSKAGCQDPSQRLQQCSLAPERRSRRCLRARHEVQGCGLRRASRLCFFFFNDTATTEIYTLSLHDALPIWIVPTCCTYSTPPRWAAPCRWW